jgi:hypothetical protein
VLDIQAGETVCPEHMLEVVVEQVPVVRDIDAELAHDAESARGAVVEEEAVVVDDDNVGPGMVAADAGVVELLEEERRIVDQIRCWTSSNPMGASCRVQRLLGALVMAKGLEFCMHCSTAQSDPGTLVGNHRHPDCEVGLANMHFAVLLCHDSFAHMGRATRYQIPYQTPLFFSYEHRDEFARGSPVQQQSETGRCFHANQETSSR